jgi:enterochelin esterase-like enzyme
MKYKQSSFFSRYRDKRLLPMLWFLVSLLIALLSGTILFASNTIGGLEAVIINIGLDPQRSLFIAALIMTLGAAFIGATLGRRKAGAFVGAVLIFGFSYLIGFVQTQLAPLLDAGGHADILHGDVLTHNTTIMLALGLLSAFIGSAVGVALADVALNPFYVLVRALWQRVLHKPETIAQATDRQHILSTSRNIFTNIGRVLTAGGMIALIVLAANSSDLFIFSPDVGVHTRPQFKDNRGQVLTSTIVPDSVVSTSLKNQRRSFVVYLPPSYNTVVGKNKRYPTLYLLHGTPGKVIDWITGGKANESADTLIATHRIPELIMVMPDGNGRPGQTPEWGNSADQKQMMENYVALDLVKYIDQNYRTIPNPAYRGIGGLSEGGFGAMNIAIHHPDIFGTAISLGGYYQAEGSIWGKNTAYKQANSPIYTIQVVQQAWKLHIFLGSATKDQPYYKDTQEFMAVLNKLHIPYHFDLEQGYHSWHVWQDQMYKAIAWIQWGQNTGTSQSMRIQQQQA